MTKLAFTETCSTSRECKFRGKEWNLPSPDIGLVYRVRAGIAFALARMSMPFLAMISNDESFVLRYDNRVFDWTIYDDKTKLSVHKTTSKIITDGVWHDI